MLMNWAAVGAVAGILALLEVPLWALVRSIRSWVRQVDKRLALLEDTHHSCPTYQDLARRRVQ